MSSPISPITGAGIVSPAIQGPAEAARPGAFQSALENAIGKVEDLRQTAAQGVEQFLAGKAGSFIARSWRPSGRNWLSRCSYRSGTR